MLFVLLTPYILFYPFRSSFLDWGLSSAVEQLTPDQPVSGSIPLALTFFCFVPLSSHLSPMRSFLLFHTSPLLLLFSSFPAFSSLYFFLGIFWSFFTFLSFRTFSSLLAYLLFDYVFHYVSSNTKARIAQSVEHGANNARVAGSRPAVSILFLAFFCLCSHP